MLIRDVLVFQVKLFVDGLRDLLLVPVSLVAGLVSFLGGGAKPESAFYDVLRLARRSEGMINLFGAVERTHGPTTDDEKTAARNLDDVVSRVESFLADECRKGGVTAQAKVRLDQALDSLQRPRKRRDRGKDSPG